MKRLLLVAPGVSPPLTEGRKLFVTELAAVLRGRGIGVEVLDGSPAKSGAAVILRSLRDLEHRCTAPDPAAAIVAFPYGTFHGLRALANGWLIRRAHAMGARADIPVLPVFYSCAGMSLEDVERRFAPALAVGRQVGRLKPIHLGTQRVMPTWRTHRGELLRLLFLCGYQRCTRRAWHNVLYERGLVDLLRAGDRLAAARIRLTVAIPFLRDKAMCDRLRATAARLCPALPIDLQGQSSPLALLAEHDAFVFPYREHHSIFVPTSLLEAMAVGIPTLAADHAMYRALTVAPDGVRCGLYRVGDADDLAKQVLAMQCDYGSAMACATRCVAEIRAEWNIERAADELLDAIRGLTQ